MHRQRLSEFGLRLLDTVNMAEENKEASSAPVENDADIQLKEGQHLFNITECNTETVVVYLDRAEICRSVKVKAIKGENELTFRGLSEHFDKDSIRVEGRGPATITEVVYQSKHLTPDQQTQNEEKNDELRNKLQEATKKLGVLNTKKHRLKKQREVLDGFADNVKNGPADRKSEKYFLDMSMLSGMTGFFDLYDKTAAKLDHNLYELQCELEKVEEYINAVEKNLSESNSTKKDKESRELSVLLDVTEAVEIELHLSYLVTQAKWTPKYDVRVFSNDSTMKILYYGMIQQATGEDWNDAKLYLSTATPSVGGTVPELGTQKLSFKYKPPVKSKKMFGMRRSFNSYDAAYDMANCLEMSAPMYKCSESFIDEDEMPLMEIPNAEVKDSITSTMYEIARRSTIPCDNVGHKVSVAIIDLKPTFEYVTVPKKACQAFLKAKVKNTSPYALLEGPTNIFLDNNFVAKANLKAVSPSEDFTCSLGSDPGIKVEYKPLHKYREQGGLISKTMTTTYRQEITVKNTHNEPIKILVTDQVPLSTEEKIKVNLVEPFIKHPEKYDLTKPTRLNRLNNVEWDLDIGPNETKELVLKYTVDHPVSETLKTSVTYADNTTSEA